jgi:hypothetical protein
MRGRGMHVGFWWESQEKRDYKEDQNLGEKMILKWSLER